MSDLLNSVLYLDDKELTTEEKHNLNNVSENLNIMHESDSIMFKEKKK